MRWATCEYIVGKTHRMHKIPSQLSDAVAVLNEPLAVARRLFKQLRPGATLMPI